MLFNNLVVAMMTAQVRSMFLKQDAAEEVILGPSKVRVLEPPVAIEEPENVQEENIPLAVDVKENNELAANQAVESPDLDQIGTPPKEPIKFNGKLNLMVSFEKQRREDWGGWKRGEEV